MFLDTINRILDLGESALGLCWDMGMIWTCILGGLIAIAASIFLLAWIVGLIILIIDVTFGLHRDTDSKDRNA